MSGQRLKRPIIFLSNNQCPGCLGTLQLVEEEVYIGALDKRGFDIGGETLVSAQLRCTKCGEIYDAEKKGVYYAIAPTLPVIPQVFKEFNPFYT